MKERLAWDENDIAWDEPRALGAQPGHEFYGNQWTAGNPMAGEVSGMHTKEAADRVRGYLERETGLQFKLHGSLGKGAPYSTNDMDLAVIDPTQGMTDDEVEAYHSKAMDEANKATAEVWDRATRGEITKDEAMRQVYGDPDAKDPVTNAMSKIGFEPVRDMSWMGISVSRFHNKQTGHTIELWASDDDQGSAENGPPPMRSRDLSANPAAAAADRKSVV